MNFLDLAIVALCVTAVTGGYRVGLLTGLTSWVVLVQALIIATWLIPSLAEALGGESPGMRLLVATLFFVAAGFGGQLVGRVLGLQYRRALPEGRPREVDRFGGAVAGPFTVVVVMWLLVIPPMANAPGWAATTARQSVIARAIDRFFPSPPDASRALSRLAGPAGMPPVFNVLGPAYDPGPPPSSTGLTPALIEQVSASTVQVEGTACDVEREGSGFAVAPDTVVTNAHVVAGQRATTVIRPDGVRLDAVVAQFDPETDLALLRVPGLGQDPLALVDAKVGDRGAVFGHPGGQRPLEVSPALVRQRLAAVGTDLYYEDDVERDVLVLAAELRPGDSGGPLITSNGTVAGIAFAIAPDRRDTTAYALAVSELEPLLQAGANGRARTGSCL